MADPTDFLSQLITLRAQQVQGSMCPYAAPPAAPAISCPPYL